MADSSNVARRLIIGIALAGVAIIAWWLLRARAGDGPSSSRTSPSAGVAQRATGTDRLDPGATAIKDGEPPPVLVTKSGAIVQDRTTHGVRDVPDPIPPGTEFDLKGVATPTGAALGTAMLPVLAQCTSELPREARGSNALVQPAFVVQVASGQLTVTDVSFSTRDIADSARGAFTECMRRGAVGTTMPAPGEADLDRYLIHIPMRLPK
ncbi:MAG: hypothetical protein IPL79_06995 [Myxococcales bacterium]|nr:hypothetical protein [Myxococcales bacterium]